MQGIALQVEDLSLKHDLLNMDSMCRALPLSTAMLPSSGTSPSPFSWSRALSTQSAGRESMFVLISSGESGPSDCCPPGGLLTWGCGGRVQVTQEASVAQTPSWKVG